MVKAHTTPEPPRDIDVLNYALTLEHLEYAFYRDGLEKFGERELENARVFDGLGRYLRRRVRENFVRIRNHEKIHVETLESVTSAGRRCLGPPTTSGRQRSRAWRSLYRLRSSWRTRG